MPPSTLSTPARPSNPCKEHGIENDKENTVPRNSTKHSILCSPVKHQPSTPPLSPRRDVNAFSPSPLRLRIRGGGDEQDKACAKEISDTEEATVNADGQDKSHAAKESDVRQPAADENGDRDRRADEGMEKKNAASMSTAHAALWHSISHFIRCPNSEDVAAEMGGLGLADADVGAGNEVEVEVEKEEIEEKNGKDKENEVAGTMSGEDVKSALLTMAADDAGANAVVVEVEKEMQDSQTGSADTVDAGGKGKESEHSAVSRDQAGEGASTVSKYVSPSDALMSPCTQQLNALKAKRIDRGGESGVRSLFRDKLEKKDETYDSGNKGD